VSDRRFNAKLILPDGTEKPSLIVYYPPTLTGEEVEDIGREILAVFSGTLCSDVEDEEGRGTTTEDMLDAGLLDADGVAPVEDAEAAVAALENARVLLESGTPDDVRQHITHAIGLLRPSGVTATPAPDDLPPVHIDVERMRKALAGPRILIPPGLSIEEVIAFINAHAAGVDAPRAAQRTLPHPGSPEASAMMDSLLAEYNYPANTKNAARAGWEAANRWLMQNAAGVGEGTDGTV
jgi:hypothetical protein